MADIKIKCLSTTNRGWWDGSGMQSARSLYNREDWIPAPILQVSHPSKQLQAPLWWGETGGSMRHPGFKPRWEQAPGSGETTTKRKRGKVTEGDTWHLLLASVCKCACVHMCTLKIKINMARNYRFWVEQLIDFPEIHTEAFLSGECQSCLQEREILFSHGA